MIPKDAPPEVSAAYIACTDKQRALALNLAKGMFKSDAMRAAGYSEGQSRKCHKDVVDHPNVVTLSQWYASQAIKKNEVTVERVIEEVCHMILADPAELFDENGNVLAVRDMPESIRRAISAVDVFEEYQGRGDDRESIGQTKKLRFWDKVGAVEKLAKMKGWYNEKVEHKHSGVVQVVTGVPRPNDKP